ncbi:hypothetical protein ACLKA6_003526 [Drosophila palustris]
MMQTEHNSTQVVEQQDEVSLNSIAQHLLSMGHVYDESEHEWDPESTMVINKNAAASNTSAGLSFRLPVESEHAPWDN